MNADHLDRAFSDFFQSEMNKRPWPPAPYPSEPSSVHRSASRDSNAHARRVLAASVAILLGSCWALSSGLTVADRVSTTNAPGANMLPGATADEKGVLPEIRKDKAKNNAPVFELDMP